MMTNIKERELNCLQEFYRLCETSETISDLLAFLVNHISQCLRSSGFDAGAMISFAEHDYKTYNYAPSKEAIVKCFRTQRQEECRIEIVPLDKEHAFGGDEQKHLENMIDHLRLVIDRINKTDDYENIFENLHEVIILADKDGYIRRVNPPTPPLFGYGSIEEMIGLHMTVLYARPEERQGMIQELERNKEFHDKEFILKKKDGTEFATLTNIRMLFDDFGQYSGTLGSIRDVTEIKKAEKELENYINRLQEAQDIAEMGWWEYDVTADQFILSDKACQIFGFPTHHGKITLKDHYTTIDPAYQRYYKKQLNKLLKSGFAEFEYQIRKPNGLKHWVYVRGRTECSSEGEIVTTKGTVIDIHDRKQAEWLRRKSEERLQQLQRIESLGVLASGIAHDFNNLLSGIFGYMDLALASISQDKEAAGYIENSLKVLGQAKDLTRQLLTFSKGGTPRKTTVNLEQLLQRSIGLSISGSSVTCHTEFHNGPYILSADPNQLNQVFNNILINARQAMPKGGMITIAIDRREYTEGKIPELDAGEYALIRIQDEGEGISQENLSKVWDPFFTTKEAGSGLGLATSHSIVKKHGGAITIHSAQGKGTMVEIHIPAQHTVSEHTQNNTKSSIKKGIRILFMDDDASVRDVVSSLLENMGMTVVCTADGQQAVEAFRKEKAGQHPFELLIFDITVPGGMGGEEAIGKIREMDPDVPAIISSGYSNSPLLSHPKKYGFNAKIEKPYRVSELKDLISSLIPKHLD